MEEDSDGSSLPLLLSILRGRKPRNPITSVINASTIELTRKLLFTKDFANLSSDLSNASDVKNLMDLMLYLLRSGDFAKPDSSRRARRLMFRAMTQTPVVPTSLFVTGVSMKAHREYIDGGGFGLVFKGKLKGAPVSLKVLYRTHNNIDFCREALMWRSLNHKFVLPFLGIYENEATSQLFIVSPYMTNGTLSQWRKKTNRSTVEIEERMMEVVQGLEYIHSEGVVHGDLRGDNVLLDDNFHVQIADFGLTRHSDSSVTQSGAALHYNSAAPELFEDYPADNADDAQSLDRAQKADIYAFGCLYYEIHFDTIPFAGIKDIQIVKRVSQGERPPRLNKPPLSDEAWKLIHRCWKKEPSKRPMMKDIANRMRAWRSITSNTQNSESRTLQSPWPRFDQFGTISKHSINEISFNGASLLDGSNSFLTTKLLVGFNPGNVSTTPPLSTRTRTPPVPRTPSRAENEGKITIAIDFGTTFSGVAYAFSRISEGKIEHGSLETLREIPTCLLYDRKGRVLAWGLEAKSAGQIHGTVRCEWFKCFMEPQNLHNEASTRLPSLPPRKQAFDLIVDYLERLWEYAKYQIVRQAGSAVDLNYADIWLTVPATWDKESRKIMREAATTAGLVQKERNSDHRWRDRLHIIAENEAVAVYCSLHADIDRLMLSQNFMIVDAGGGSCTLAVYKVIGETENPEIAEMCKQSSSDCGSISMDMRFRGLVKILLSDHPAHLDAASLAYFVHSFAETEKLTYLGLDDDATMFHFTCFNREDPNDPSVGLINGQLCIPGKLLRDMVFDPVINQVLTLIEQQIEKMTESIDALFLVGGAGSVYLKQRIETQFGSKIATISRPADAGTATLRGAIQCGLSGKQLVSSVMAPRSYMINVKLPAEREDVLRRPEYVMNNYGSTAICENRVRYLLEKGTILRKGQRSISLFRKFSKNALDCLFVVTIFASDEDKLMRYADEGTIGERCKWVIDLSSLPTFKQNASMYQSGGFYTDFEVGLEMDKTEVRGVLLHDNQEWGWQWTIIDNI